MRKNEHEKETDGERARGGDGRAVAVEGLTSGEGGRKGLVGGGVHGKEMGGDGGCLHRHRGHQRGDVVALVGTHSHAYIHARYIPRNRGFNRDFGFRVLGFRFRCRFHRSSGPVVSSLPSLSAECRGVLLLPQVCFCSCCRPCRVLFGSISAMLLVCCNVDMWFRLC